MSIKILGKQSMIYGIGYIMARLVTFLLLPLYTNVFTQEQYGVISLAYAFIGFAMILYRYGMDTALIKYSVQEKGDIRKKHITIILFSHYTTKSFNNNLHIITFIIIVVNFFLGMGYILYGFIRFYTDLYIRILYGFIRFYMIYTMFICF